ncbi:MAG TPA: two-component regulator propeller domain-containing protein [Prolixibacteraceae bacterium]|nr:two-component regulator propeller domain-containing protein [Prolixibacteraceae bacterium]
MIYRLACIIVFLIIGTCSQFLYGQKIRFYNSEQGLPNSLIHKVSQDSLGYIWIATENGASCFDGVRFTTYHHDNNKQGTIASDLVKAIFTDSQGLTWVGTSNGLQIYDRTNNIFRDFPLQCPNFNLTPYITSIVESIEEEKLLVSVSGYGIMVYDINNKKLDIETTERLKDTYNNSYLGNLFTDSKGTIWSHSEQGSFYRLNYSNKKLENIIWGDELAEISKKVVVSAIAEDPVNRNMIIGTYNHGIFIFDRALNCVRRPKGFNNQNLRIRSLLAERIEKTNTRPKIWLGTEDSGLKLFDTTTEAIVIPDFEYAPIDLENCKVHSIMQDVQGNVWAGIFQKGLLIVPKLSNRFDYIKLSGSKGSMSTNIACATSIARDLKNNLWVGTDGGGLFKITENGEKKRFTIDNTPLQNNAVLSLIIDKQGTLWISTYMGGITTYNDQNGFSTFSSNKELQKVICTCYDAKNNCIYVGTLGYGVKILSLNGREIQSLPNIDEILWTSSLTIDNNGILLIGHTQGLCFYNTLTGQETNLDIAHKVKGCAINVSMVDKNGNYWLGSSTGLIYVNSSTHEVEFFTKSNGLPSNSVCAIHEDKKSQIWISTMNGISNFDPETKQFKNYYLADGLQDNEFRMKASHKDVDGKLFFGGINGVTSFYPKNIVNEDKLVSKIYFSELRVLNRKIDYDELLGTENIIDKHISQAKHIKLKHSQNVFSIDFTVLEFANPLKLVYGYMLNNFDNEWQYTGSNHRMATYTNLPQGKYVLKIKAYFEGNINEENVAYNDINITILPPWYKTWWAYMIYLIVFMLSSWEVQNFFIRRKNHQLERIEYEKKEMKLQLFTDISHEIRTPLSIVLDPIKSMRKTEADNKRIEVLNFMYRNVLRVLSLLNQMVDIREMDNQQFKMCFQKTDLFSFLKDIMKSFDQLALMRNIDFRIVSNYTSLDIWIDRVHFDKVIFNILSNAFKNTPENGIIMISVDSFWVKSEDKSESKKNEFVEICIENLGVNIVEDDIEQMFDRFFQSKNNLSSGSGIGMYLAKKIVESHFGTIKAHNVENGVAIVIKIPLGLNHLANELCLDIANVNADSLSIAGFSVSDKEQVVSSNGQLFYPFQGDEKPARSILLIDNDIDWGNYLRMELSSKYNVEICNDPQKAWKSIISTMPDAVLTDILLPNIDGITICKKIKENPETNFIPVIILSSLTDEDSERMSFSAGADHFITKPTSLDLLTSTIDQAIQTRVTLRNRFRADLKYDFDNVKMISSDNRLIAKVIETIRNNIENADFSVDELSSEVGLSRVHLNRKLKENLNISPGNLIKSIRLKQAAYLLVNNKLNVSEVAFKLGYSSHSYFSNIFKEYFGMSPTEFVNKFSDTDSKENLTKIFEV